MLYIEYCILYIDHIILKIIEMNHIFHEFFVYKGIIMKHSQYARISDISALWRNYL